MALSNRTGEAEFANASNPFMSRLDRTGPTTGKELQSTRSRTSSKSCGTYHVSVLKINVAGFEPEVIEGAMQVSGRRTCRHSHPPNRPSVV